MAEADAEALRLYQALAAGQIEVVLADGPALARALAPDRPALSARVYAWLSQARLQAGDAPGAAGAAMAGQRAARAAKDADGLVALRGLQASAMAAQAAAAEREKAPPADTPAGRAVLAIDEGRLGEGEALAEAALAESSDDREQIIALLALARLPHRRDEALDRAMLRADASGDMNLVTAVAHALRAAGRPPSVREF